MREQFGDIWKLAKAPNSVVCVTTNGYVNSRGECVMGKGVALQAKKRYPRLAKVLGTMIKYGGNHAREALGVDAQGEERKLVIFPTKHVWFRPASLELIRESAELLRLFAVNHPERTYYLPRPGCQNGGLKWAEVGPVLREVGLPENVVVVTNDLEQWQAGSDGLEVDELLAEAHRRVHEGGHDMLRRFLCLGCTEGEHHLCNPAEYCECDHNQPVPDWPEEATNVRD